MRFIFQNNDRTVKIDCYLSPWLKTYILPWAVNTEGGGSFGKVLGSVANRQIIRPNN